MTNKALKFGPLGRDTVHVCVDMQRLFGEETQWHTRDLTGILKNTGRLIAHAPARTIFTRFRTPNTADAAPGQWRHYYRRWDKVLASRLPEEMFGVMPDLAGFVPPAVEIDKTTYNAFETPAFRQALDRLKPQALIFSGVETDVCVLATLLAAVDRGYRSVVARDAVASGNAAGHRAALEMVIVRYDMQIEIADTADILAQWQPDAKR
ncbi:MAG: cysteine hydrolase [Dongiaceae bacterium]